MATNLRVLVLGSLCVFLCAGWANGSQILPAFDYYETRAQAQESDTGILVNQNALAEDSWPCCGGVGSVDLEATSVVHVAPGEVHETISMQLDLQSGVEVWEDPMTGEPMEIYEYPASGSGLVDALVSFHAGDGRAAGDPVAFDIVIAVDGYAEWNFEVKRGETVLFSTDSASPQLTSTLDTCIGEQLSTHAQMSQTAGPGSMAWSHWEVSLTGTPVPEPTSLALLGIGASMLLRRRRTI